MARLATSCWRYKTSTVSKGSSTGSNKLVYKFVLKGSIFLAHRWVCLINQFAGVSLLLLFPFPRVATLVVVYQVSQFIEMFVTTIVFIVDDIITGMLITDADRTLEHASG